ncbi:SDR family NAD(P)-dependent oxidoreductase [Fulvivirga sp. 29W222]|uniref:SDR family NAD(P)-dependent oxidoreductase n=1 Tax=Fulvivirga marina TaxID=2494733 RepID=A0A937G3Z5_9BACT|nr:SDR family NAD(P)-dependent oxidoreductase [Fulvivirga marina]MBL6449565.1 SDR family NAD(P)-dependent oxidoreductase [Fulvivirga marina]
MLKLLKFCCHGYVAMPVIEACHKHGLFTLLDGNKFHTRKGLIKELKANESYFSVALQALESLGWLEKNDKDAYRLTGRVDKGLLDLNLTSLYAIEPESLTQKVTYAKRLGKQIEKVLLTSPDSNNLGSDLVKGAIIAPLITSLKSLNTLVLETDKDNFKEVLGQLNKDLAEPVEQLFVRYKWLTNDGLLTEEGRHILQADVWADVIAYRPMLQGIDQLLFGDPKRVFGKGKNKEATHVDKAFEAKAEKALHDRYYKDIQQEIIDIFNQVPVEEQPQVIVDAACSDGTLLKDIYATVSEHTRRGQHLEQYPLQLVGVGTDAQALKKASEALKSAGIPHQTMAGDINNPDDIRKKLKDLGVKTEKDVLHIHSFSDHTLAIDAKQPINDSLSPLVAGQLEHYVDQNGQILDALTVLSHWQRHLRAWAESIEQSRLLLLEAHTLPAHKAFEYLDRSENFYFDTIHGLAHHYLIGAEAFLILAANTGLFNKYQVKHYPELSSFSRVSLHQLTKRDYIIRFAIEDDIESLLQLEDLCWKESLRTPKEQILARIKQYPQGQFVLEKEGKVQGVIYSQRIINDAEIEKHDSGNVHELHNPEGSIIQLIAVNIHPDTQNLSYGDQLLEFMLQRCSLIPGITRVVAVSLCKNYNTNEAVPMERYIQLKGSKQDPILAFHDAHGARIVKPVANYRPLDTANLGYGVLIEYDILSRLAQNNRNRTIANEQPVKSQAKATLNTAEIRQFLQDAVAGLLDTDGTTDFDRPVMETGLSSVDLMALQKQIEEKFSQALQTGFFFEYNNLNKVVDYLSTLEVNATIPEGTTKQNNGSAVDKQQISKYLLNKVNALLDIQITTADFDRPIMEIGLNSADLLLLQKQIEEKFNMELQAGFFFEHNSLNKVINYLASHTEAVTGPLHIEVSGQEKQQNITSGKEALDTDIAIVGISCKLPGGIESADDLWEALSSAKSMISPFPKERGEWPAGAERSGIDHGGFLHQGDTFDASFFRMSPKEATATDPQQRILLELAWSCLEDASIVPATLKGSDTGVFIGASNCDYYRLMQSANLETQAHHAIGSSLAVLANRISYFYDFNGPSLIIDTACSASLVALHTAIKSLRSGECSSALVGGVNFICYPDLSIAYQSAGMLSPDSRCKVFDASANGYVRSEGAVMLMLKPLHKAIEDKDQIRAIIKGSAINHGGLGGGLTVPNPQKQSELYTAAWKNAGISPQELSYIEAHGTGTSLGDPIEIQGIKTAYTKLVSAEEARDCGIGSVKSNLGHLESAAGITGLLKVILAMQHRQLPPSINYKDLNPKIQLEGTSFRIQNRLQDWEVETPRLAGVSSFGSGGANAHVVVQEYETEAKESIAVDHNLFVLSAANNDRLREYAEKVVRWSEKVAGTTHFTDAIYNWQVGRMPMKHRLAIKVTGWEDLRKKLQQWLSGEHEIEGIWTGQVGQPSEGEQPLEALKLSERDLEKIAEKWIAGADIEWNKLYTKDIFGDNLPKRITLPTYPFAKNRYWIEQTEKVQQLPVTTAAEVLHPLLHRNTSDLGQQSYSSTFTGEELFLSKGSTGNVLPAAAYLEMARVAIEQALPTQVGTHGLELHNIVWSGPTDIKPGNKVSVALFAQSNEEIDFEIYSQDNGEVKVHCQGQAAIKAQLSPTVIDVEQLRKQLVDGPLEQTVLYSAFSSMGLSYGPSYQAITSIYQDSQQLLAHLRLPKALESSHEAFALHPSVADGAFQAGMALLVSTEETDQPLLAYGIDSLNIIKEGTREMYAWVRYSVNSKDKVDIDLCDSRGNVCVQLRGVSYQTEALSFEIQPVEVQEEYEPQEEPKSMAVAPKQIHIAPPIGKNAASDMFEVQKFATVSLKKPTNVSLVAPEKAKLESTDRESTQKVSISLSSTSTGMAKAASSTSEASYISLFDNGNGIYAIKIDAKSNNLSKEVAAQLVHTLEYLKQSESVKALTLSGSNSVFLQGGREEFNIAIEENLYQTLASFPHPVIAVMQGDATGAGFMVGALCDFMVCSEASTYAYTVEGLLPTVSEEKVLIERFGEAFAKDLLYQSAARSGRELKANGWSFPIVPSDEVEVYAKQLAEDLASKSALSLSLLKQHLGRHILAETEMLKAVKSLKTESKVAASHQITSSSKLLKVEAEAEQVLTLKIAKSKKKDKLKDISSGLTEIFSQIEKGKHYKAVILTSDNPEFVSGKSDEVLSLLETLNASPVPVIAATEGATDAGWLISQSCDACIYRETGTYSAASLLQDTKLARVATMILGDRLSHHVCKEILLTEKVYTGADLQQTGATSVSSDVLSAAQQQAQQWTKLPWVAVTSWKKDRAAIVSAEQMQLPEWVETEEKTSGTLPKAPTAINLKSPVVKATVHPEGIVEVRMEDREAKNMFSPAFMEGVVEVFEHIAQTPTYKAVILTGYDNYFISGGTKEMLLDIQEGKIKFTDTKIYHLAMECKVPVIAAMQGHGIGAGWSMGMFADFTLFSDESHYVSPYMTYGFTPGAGSTMIFPDRTGYDLARETLLTAVEYSGRDLKNKGLLLPVIPRKEVIKTAFDLARQIVRHSRSSLVALKHQLTAHLQARLEENYLQELDMHEKTFVGRTDTLQQIQSNFHQEGEDQPTQTTSAPVQNTTANADVQHEILATLKMMLAQELHMEESDIDEDSQFVDLGLDSIIGVTWIRKINEKYKISINATKVYSYPNLKQFSGYVKDEAEKAGTISKAPVSVQSTPVATPVSAPKDAQPAILASLKSMLAQELHMEESDIDEDSQFVDLGLDSIIGVTWIRKINEKYKISINATKVYSYPNLKQFSSYVKDEAEKSGTLPVEVEPVLEKQPVAGLQSKVALTPTLRKLTSRRSLSVTSTTAPVKEQQSQAIAIIGMAGQFPEAKNVEEFWQNIAEGKNCIREIPKKRWDIDQYYQEGEVTSGKTYSRWMGVLEEYDLFDPLFFNISPSEAESMDPQQRLFLQACWHAIENAGYSAKSLGNSKCGVYVGCGQGDYHLLSRDLQISAYGFTGGDNSILAARISYFLNLQGPCLTIDTACSSSLVAIANACDSLVLGKSDTVLAGGVYIGAGPDMHLKTSQMGMLSPDGKCYSFDQRANGFVPGEGVGVVMLKRLEDAERDNDNILGVIQGWGVNQDGKTNGITAPNTEAQSRLQQEVYDKYKIDPASIQLVEAHGTGTKLGDPIEVEALVESFKKYTQEKEYCALGSVKSNIGHCLMAAGVAGMIKLIMSMKHKQLPPTINFEKLNEHISLDNSPFYVNTQLKDWEVEDSELRKAAISSFGFSGTNAHIVVEEYPSPVGAGASAAGFQNVDCIIPMSARTEEQLKQKASDLLDYVRMEGQSLSLADIAYTLQIGRVDMDQRLGLVASSIDQLAEKLKAFVEGKSVNNVFAGKAKRNEDTISLFAEDMDLQDTIDKWVQQRKLSNLINLWVKGYELDWNKLYDNVKPNRINLPVYPFAKERYWIDADEAVQLTSPAASAIHPLLHRNTSVLSQQRFGSSFSGNESYLELENGVKVLPGLAALEMARAAVEHSLLSQPEVIELRNIVWAAPMVAAAQTEFNIYLYEKGNSQIDYEISSQSGDEEIIYSQGEARLSHTETAGPVVNIEQLKGNMKPGGINITDQELTNFYQGETQFLAQLSLPNHTANDQSGFGLYPAMMKHTLKAVDVFRNDYQSSAPIDLRSIRIISPCTDDMYVWGRFSQRYQPGDEIVSVDIDLCDNLGNVCVEMRGLSLSINDQGSMQEWAAANENVAELLQDDEATQTLFFSEDWEARPYTGSTSVPAGQQTIIFTTKEFREKLIAETANPLSKATIVEQADSPASQDEISKILDHITEAGKPVRIIYMWAKDQGETGIHMLFDLFKAIKSSASIVTHVALVGQYDPTNVNTCWDYSWIGFERSMKLILPNIQLSLLYTDTASCTPQQLLDAAGHNGVLWYKQNQRFLLSLQTCKPGKTTEESVLKQSGNYLITGGCGNLGLQFARYLAENYHANLVLVGRRQMTSDIKSQLSILKEAGAGEVSYHSVDVSNREAIQALQAELPFDISGIIHAAGVESSEPFYNRSTSDINAVLHPKSIGSLLLDEAFDQPSLDFICYFSSVSAFLGDFGSCDYAVASRFQMAYSHYREQKGQHNGKTLVINWPLWQEGGMGTSDSAQTSFYLKSSGQEPLQTSQGVDIWHDLLRSERLQTLVMLGKPSRVEQVLSRLYTSGQSEVGENAQNMANVMAGKGWKPQYQGLSLKECITSDLKQVVSALTKINQNQLNITENLTDYGFDSISLSEFAKRLTTHFGVEVTPAVFFSATTIDKLSAYFLDEHAEHVEGFYRQDSAVISSDNAKVVATRLKSLKPAIRRRVASGFGPQVTGTLNQEPIAIVGMSGRFPQARTVDQLWTILAEGKDAITEIPASRWDWRKYFTVPGDENNKITINKGGFIHGVDEFDPLFFEISPREAEQMDPAERLLLIETYKAIEDARISPSDLRGEKVGMFVGMEEGQYDHITGKQGISTTGNAMISSRLSYFLDLHGPAIATNTACSSGLVALHQAVSSLRQGECKSAIVAGISLLISPDSYVMMSEAGMLSQDGHCHTFSKNANGIGVGESVVVFMLKPLSAAVADGDSIYGTIKASGINFDGKTNGVTAPNGDRQAELIEKVYADHQIDTNDLSYIVTHGTGTKLGDPVEINALVKAFRNLNGDRPTQGKQGHCALTSCKSNVGHTLAASGLVSVVNLLKAIQHRQIPASLNCEEENDYITWNNSPFFINKETREWNKEQGRPYLGAVSSFGRSGTNAHVVIEEYQTMAEEVRSAPVTYTGDKEAILLSARTEEQLQQKARDLFDFITDSTKGSIELPALAYSLQVCREEFEVRLGFLVSSVDQLVEKLQAYLDGAEDLEDTYQGKVKRNQEDMSIINDDEDMKEAIDKWINRRKLSKLLELWVKGLTLDWKKFYGENKPKRIALPTYPFAQDRYWIDAASKGQFELSGIHSNAQLHPLVHRNTSDLLQQSYSSTFRGSDLFVGDYHYKENTILPAAAYLEMARAAVEMAMPAMEEPAAIALHQLEWAEPCIVDQDHSVRITLAAQDDELISYEIFSTEADEEVIHFSGYAAFTAQPEAMTLDVHELMRYMSDTMEVSGLYHALESAGINYGQSLQAISAIHLGSQQVLVKLKTPVATEGNYILHPAIMDSVLQASMALIADAEPLVPVALESVTTVSACVEEMYAWIRFSPGVKAGDEHIKLDIDLCDLQGNVAVLIEGLELSHLSAAPLAMKGTDAGTTLSWDKVSYLTQWEEQAVSQKNVEAAHKNVLIVCGETTGFEKDILAHYEQNAEAKILLIRIANKTKQISDQEWQCGTDDHDGFKNCLKEIEEIDTLYFISMAEPKAGSIQLKNMIDGQESNEIQLLRLIKFLKQSNKINDKVESYILTQDTYSIYEEPNNFNGAGITGLAYSLAQSSYQFRVRNLDLSSEDLKTPESRRNTLGMILHEPPADRGEVFKLRSGKRYRQLLYKLNWDTNSHSAIRHHGVYLIVGGTGTVGKIMTRNLIEQYGATVVWLGRSEETSERVQAAMQQFEKSAENLLYIQADATDPNSMKQAIVSIKQKHPAIHGAMFAGMVFRFENSLDQTTESEFRSIFDLKAQGSWVFYDALKDESLDFMCYFSSGQAYSFSGASKLSAYACGITYADSFVHAIRKQADFPVGIINWGFWKSTTETITANKDGVTTGNFDALEDLEGFKCFEQFVGELHQGRVHQVLCMKASQHIETLMNCNPEDMISLTGTSALPSTSLDESEIEIPYEKIKKLKLAEEKSDLEDWLVQLLFCQMDQLVKSAGLEKPNTMSDLREQCGVLDKYIPWWEACLNRLNQNKYIQWKGDTITKWKKVDAEATWKKWQVEKEKYLQNPDRKAWVGLVNDCLERLPEILQGKTLATDVIFPNSSMEKVEGVYKNNLMSDTFNEIVANAVVAYVQQKLQADPNARLRMLEIGAGTGGTSAVIFDRLQPYKESIEKYCYTDLSKAFFFHAEKNYLPDNPYIECQRLDIEQPIDDQGIEVGTYDLVIATNVLHATKDIRRTLRNAKAVLHQEGYILINELSTPALFNHLTFGLLDGWWLFTDAELRMPGSPGLYPAGWQHVLEEEGFPAVLFPAKEAHMLGQQIILAQSNGAIRRKISVKKDEKIAPKTPATVKSKPVQIPVQKQKVVQMKKPQPAAKPSLNIQDYISTKILNCLSETLKISSNEIDSDMAFSDYGIDSILGVSFINQINEVLSISLNTAIIFEHSTVNRLSKHVMNSYQSQIEPDIEVQAEATVMEEEEVVTQVYEERTASRASILPQSRFTFRNKPSSRLVSAKTEVNTSEIAVVGISGMFPKAENIEEFWHNLVEGIDGVDELPERYLDQKNFFSSKKQAGKTRCKWAGIVEDRDCFDPLFFNISPKEAESMNPHQRLVLQESWNALENAGYNPRALSGSQTGIYIGAEPTGYSGDTFTGYSDAIIASRLSYILNLNGPSFVVNTGCSSSAVALHLACESLRNRETDMALAGGVNACLEQNMLIRLDEIEMLSPSGRCFTFDQSADGTIMSEGVGIVVLKRLDDAIEAGDKIYGLISGSGINQDGASNGITAPNGEAQEKLIVDVYNKFNIDPEKISYVEAHGTGTKLGDPVETNALVRAFRNFTESKEYCAVGSAKSYIGHAAAAAGVIGLIKVLLSMQHNKIPKLLNFKTMNPLIEFDGSPFYINTEVQEWEPLKDAPRMAAINSFGHSGTNAHLVVKEFIQPESKPTSKTGEPVIVPLSAKTPEQLQQRANELLNFVKVSQGGMAEAIDMVDMAYTLQTGREAMEERLAFIVSSVEELADKLQAFVNGERNIENTWVGQAKRNKDIQSLFSGDLDLQEIIDKWIARNKLSSLTDLWVKGLDLDWLKLYEGVKPHKVHLPSYPFAKERYWYHATKGSVQAKPAGLVGAVIHPLLHQNTSDLNQQSYTTTFSGEEFFLTDHRVNENKVLPAVAYLEMAQVAANMALPVHDEPFILELQNTVWLKPVVVGEQKQVTIALFENDEDGTFEKVDFEIYSLGNDTDDLDGETIHCQGQAIFGRYEVPARLDIDQLRAQMQEGTIEPDTVYDSFRKIGMNYGPAHQCVTAVYMGEDQLLAHLNMAEQDNQHDFVLHPAMMDCALQACIGLMVDLDDLPSRPLLPFALESVRVIAACTEDMYVWARYAQGSQPGDKLIKLDIDLCDHEGNVCVQMHGFSSRALDGKIEQAAQKAISDQSYDDGFYNNIIEKVLNNEISVEEAAELD